jgi:hypothetical protein
MYIVETLPRAGVPILYQFGRGKVHRAVIDSGILMTYCGIHAGFPKITQKKFGMTKFADPNKDTFSTNVISYQGQEYRCQKCR